VAPLDVNKVEVTVGPKGFVTDVALVIAGGRMLLDDVLIQGILASCLRIDNDVIKSIRTTQLICFLQ